MRRRAVLLITSMTAALVVASGVALAATITCTGGLCVGTSQDDTMNGTNRKDTMRGRGGDDELRGLGSDDLLLGNDGNDALLGESGSDQLHGGFGDDDIFAQDGEPDEIRCGEDPDGLDTDVVHADPPSVPGGISPDTFPDDSCETIDDALN